MCTYQFFGLWHHFFSGKSAILVVLLFFNIGRGVAILKYLKHSPGDTGSKYIWVCGSDSTYLSVNQGQTDRQAACWRVGRQADKHLLLCL